MASLKMRGPYELADETIEDKVTETSPGNYAIGKEGENGAFVVGYVGRSDSDIKRRLKAWSAQAKFRLMFKFSYAPSSRVAFEKECEHYHAFSPPGKHVHPQPPEGEDWRCPQCAASGRPDR
jgi:hypothetical protein